MSSNTKQLLLPFPEVVKAEKKAVADREPRDFIPDDGYQQSMFELYSTPEHVDFSKENFLCKVINSETAADIALQYHYAHAIPSITVAFGAYVKHEGSDLLAGIITYGVSANRNTSLVCGKEYKPHVLELNRLYCFDWAGRNTESWLVGQSFKLLQALYPEYYIIVSYSDMGQNHYGYIYQATNFIYTGVSGAMGTAGYIVDGKKLHNRSVYSRFGTCGRRGVRMQDKTAVPFEGTKKHRYVFFLGSKAQRKKLLAALKWKPQPYPKPDVIEGDNNVSQ